MSLDGVYRIENDGKNNRSAMKQISKKSRRYQEDICVSLVKKKKLVSPFQNMKKTQNDKQVHQTLHIKLLKDLSNTNPFKTRRYLVSGY